MRRCKDCNKEMPMEEFGHNGRYFRWQCKNCRKPYAHLKYLDYKAAGKTKYFDRGIRNANLRKRLKANRMGVLEHYGKQCACCGESKYEFLAIDHINNDGAEQRRSMPNIRGSKFMRWLILNNYPTNFQILCHNCNMAKGFYGQCPHQEVN